MKAVSEEKKEEEEEENLLRTMRRICAGDPKVGMSLTTFSPRSSASKSSLSSSSGRRSKPIRGSWNLISCKENNRVLTTSQWLWSYSQNNNNFTLLK
jgi:hypothetical protein